MDPKVNPRPAPQGLAASIWAPRNSSAEPTNTTASNGRASDVQQSGPRVQPRTQPTTGNSGNTGSTRAPGYPWNTGMASVTEDQHVVSPAVSWGASPEETSAQKTHDASQERQNIQGPPAKAAIGDSSRSQSNVDKQPTLEELRRIRDEWKDLEERAALEDEIRNIKARLQKRGPGN